MKDVGQANVKSYTREKSGISRTSQISSRALAELTDKVIVIGASTGGTEAIRQVISEFPAGTPGVVIVQHMPSGFTKMFADRLNEQCEMTVKEAQHGDRVLAGRILIAPGDFHMAVKDRAVCTWLLAEKAIKYAVTDHRLKC